MGSWIKQQVCLYLCLSVCTGYLHVAVYVCVVNSLYNVFPICVCVCEIEIFFCSWVMITSVSNTITVVGTTQWGVAIKRILKISDTDLSFFFVCVFSYQLFLILHVFGLLNKILLCAQLVHFLLFFSSCIHTHMGFTKTWY